MNKHTYKYTRLIANEPYHEYTRITSPSFIFASSCTYFEMATAESKILSFM